MPGGQQISVGQGSLGAPGVALLSGQQINTGQGAVTWHPNETGLLIGQPVTTGQGTLTFRSQNGQQITSFQGSVSVLNPQPPLTGQQINTAQGTVLASGNQVTVHINGIEASALAGIVANGPVLLTGVQGTFAAGLLGNSHARPLDPMPDVGDGGTSTVVFAGFLVPNIEADDSFIFSAQGIPLSSFSVPMVGSSVTTASGLMSASDKQAALSGTAATMAQGTPVQTTLRPLLGSSAQTSQNSVGAPGVALLTGSVVTLSPGTITGISVTKALTGTAITAAAQTIAGTTSPALSGQQITTAQEGIGPRTQLLSGLSLNVDQGNIAYRENRLIGVAVAMGQGTMGTINTGINYTPVDDSQNPAFVPVNDAQPDAWGNVSKSQVPGWHVTED